MTPSPSLLTHTSTYDNDKSQPTNVASLSSKNPNSFSCMFCIWFNRHNKSLVLKLKHKQWIKKRILLDPFQALIFSTSSISLWKPEEYRQRERLRPHLSCLLDKPWTVSRKQDLLQWSPLVLWAPKTANQRVALDGHSKPHRMPINCLVWVHEEWAWPSQSSAQSAWIDY